jgi:Mitochondrial carrier protein
MEKGSFIQEFVAGNVGGLIGISVVHPLDTAKIRMQTHTQYKSTSAVSRKMVQTDGVQSLYRGLASPEAGFGLTFAITFRYHIMSLFSLYDAVDFLLILFNSTLAYSNMILLLYVSAYGHMSRQIAISGTKKESELTYPEMTLAGVVTGFVQSPIR